MSESDSANKKGPTGEDSAPADEPHEPVGYGRPPKQHQFPKGKSGNPRGRPRKEQRTASQIINDILDRRAPLTIGGVVKHMSEFEAFLEVAVNLAKKGDRKLLLEFMRYKTDGAFPRARNAPSGVDEANTGGFVILPEKARSTEEWCSFWQAWYAEDQRRWAAAQAGGPPYTQPPCT